MCTDLVWRLGSYRYQGIPRWASLASQSLILGLWSKRIRMRGVDEVRECISSRPLTFIIRLSLSVAGESPSVLYQPLMKTTSWLLKHLVVVFTYWLVKLIDRFSMSPPSHKGFFLVPNNTATLSLHLQVVSGFLGLFAHCTLQSFMRLK